MSEEHIIYAFEFDGQGGGTPLTGQAVSDKIKQDVLAWVHLNADHPQTREWLEQECAYLDPLILDALLAEETRPRTVEYPEGFMVILRGVNLNENEEEEDMISVRLWIDPHRIISMQKRDLRSVHSIADRLREGKGPKTCGGFLTTLISNLTSNMEPVIAALDEDMDQLEETLIEDPDRKLRNRINDLRTKTIFLRRYIAPQKEAIAHLRSSEVPWMDRRHVILIQENLDRMTRLVEDLDMIRERGSVVKDELSNALADQMNKNLYVLSLIAALFLPLGFLTGLLGINVGGMPGVESDAAFWLVCGLCLIIFAGEYVLFRMLRWI